MLDRAPEEYRFTADEELESGSLEELDPDELVVRDVYCFRVVL